MAQLHFNFSLKRKQRHLIIFEHHFDITLDGYFCNYMVITLSSFSRCKCEIISTALWWHSSMTDADLHQKTAKDRFSVGLAVIDGLWFTACLRLRSRIGWLKALIVFTKSARLKSVKGFCPLGKNTK